MPNAQDSTPVLDAIRSAREVGLYPFSLPGHRFGAGIDDHTASVLSRETFSSDVIMAKAVVGDAERLYADAVEARDAVFTTCGSSISIHTALLLSPRAAFFSATEQVADPVGRISAEMVSPYPPGVPAVLPGERFTRAVVDYVRAGLVSGMTIPDASDPTLETFRVVRR